jgi:predicted DsbA family dithiol-disulfide isomerase
MHVEIWSDVVCPWCYIGKRRFEAALARFPHRDEVQVVYRSFELDPNAPRGSNQSTQQVLASKYGVSLQQAAAMNDRVNRLAAEEELEYHLDRARYANTFDAHRMIHLAGAHRLQHAAKERLMRAYFTDGEDVADPETLVRLLVEVGVDADAARAVLAGDAYADAVRQDERRARSFGVQGVPFFVFDEKYGVSGAQPSDVLLSVLEQVWAETHPLTPLGSTDAALCTDDSCALPTAQDATSDATV